MHCGDSSFVISVLTIFTCGTWVNAVQHPFNQRPTIASESVHAALVQAAIIPDGEYDPTGSTTVAFPFLSSVSISARGA